MGSRTPLFGYHSKNAHMGTFAGFDMPLWFEGIIPEVMAVREGAGLFDVSHMGRVILEGRDAPLFLDHITTNRLSSLQPFQARYALLCNEEGGILDDVISLRMDEGRYLITWNAANRQRDMKWSEEHVEGFDVKFEDISNTSFMMALQGPLSQSVLQPLCDLNLDDLKRYRGARGRVGGAAECLITRTGYTGEDGFEIISSQLGEAEKVWNAILGSGAVPAGLGARDVLRMEAGFPLYGQDMDEGYNPLEARLEFVVDMEKPSFVGREALLKISREGIARWRIGVKMLDRGIPRQGFKIGADGEALGEVTSGTYSPSIKTGIAMGYIQRPLPCGTAVQVRIREREGAGVVSEMPFYNEETYGWKRRKF